MRFQKAWFRRARGFDGPTDQPVPPPVRQDRGVDMYALGINAIAAVKIGHLADCHVDMIRFVPRRVVDKRDVGLLGGGGLRR
ncbi:Uncharacterised protein [Mycobacterium tuberculosis]|nr:Uncharacterised protein [Mycobacterium tuberculosis]